MQMQMSMSMPMPMQMSMPMSMPMQKENTAANHVYGGIGWDICSTMDNIEIESLIKRHFPVLIAEQIIRYHRKLILHQVATCDLLIELRKQIQTHVAKYKHPGIIIGTGDWLFNHPVTVTL